MEQYGNAEINEQHSKLNEVNLGSAALYLAFSAGLAYAAYSSAKRGDTISAVSLGVAAPASFGVAVNRVQAFIRNKQ